MAEFLGCAPQTVYQYASGRRTPPPTKCCQIEQFTNNEVSRKDLRKDWAQQWPELATNE